MTDKEKYEIIMWAVKFNKHQLKCYLFYESKDGIEFYKKELKNALTKLHELHYIVY